MEMLRNRLLHPEARWPVASNPGQKASGKVPGPVRLHVCAHTCTCGVSLHRTQVCTGFCRSPVPQHVRVLACARMSGSGVLVVGAVCASARGGRQDEGMIGGSHCT